MRAIQLLALVMLASAARADDFIDFDLMSASGQFHCCDYLGASINGVFAFSGSLYNDTGVIFTEPDPASGISGGPLISHLGNTWTYDGGLLAIPGDIFVHGKTDADCAKIGAILTTGPWVSLQVACYIGRFVNGSIIGDLTATVNNSNPEIPSYLIDGEAYLELLPPRSKTPTIAFHGPIEVRASFIDDGFSADNSWRFSGIDPPLTLATPEPMSFLLLSEVCALALWRSRHRERR